ncbi:MAG: MHS family proline/betaine transporter-like MFS transporter [Francisella sp.]|jgi:MHS family proline/betaine transporter-like MFS transporter
MKKLLILIASSAEWYEFVIYSFCAVYIGQTFFPFETPFSNFLAAFGAFAAGFLARPFGGIIFGYIGDRKSRSTALGWAAFFMGIPTVGIALLPSYASIGILAPLMLVALRILQGIAIGGQYTGSAVILIEAETTVAGKAKASANVIASAYVGMLLAVVSFQAINYFIPEEFMAAGGWRILFGVAIVLVIMSFFIKKMNKDDDKKPQQAQNNISLRSLVIENKSAMFYMLLLCFPGAIVAYFLVTILPNILSEVLHDNTQNIPMMIIVGLLIFIAMFYVSAKLTKYFNIKTVMASGLVLMVILPLPMYHLYKLNTELLIVFFVTMSAIFGLFYGTILAIFAESFPKEIRYTGFALTYNIGFGIYGGLLPFVCFYLAKNISDYTAVSIICISAIVGLVALYMFEPVKTKEFTSRID